MISSQQDLDKYLDQKHTIQVSISPDGPLPNNNTAYNSLQAITQKGFTFTPRELIHAIGCKTAAIPMSERDECLKTAWLYTHILDLQGPHLSFRGAYSSDLQAVRSQEIGIGMMCLIAERHFGIPWDQLGPLPGPGKRFDYRGMNAHLQCIFESKGTSREDNQTSQIKSGLDKKEAHHSRGEHFDVELIISSCIGRNGDPPRIILADPDKSSFRELYDRGNNRYFRLKHYCRVLQYVGLPRSAYQLNRYAREYLYNRRSIYRTIIDEKETSGYLETLWIDGDEFLGKWFNSWVPKDSIRYKRLYNLDIIQSPLLRTSRYVFQGMRRDVYESGLTPKPFSQPLIEKQNREKYDYYNNSRVSVFADGTIMIFRQE